MAGTRDKFVEIAENNGALFIRLLHPRLEGDDHVLSALAAFDGARFADIEIDFGDVEYMNSRGITELVSIYRKFARDKARLRFRNVRGRVRHIMDLVELHHIAEIEGQ